MPAQQRKYKTTYKEITGTHQLWGINLLIIGEDNFRLEYLRFAGNGIHGPGATINHIQKYYNFKQVNYWCSKHGFMASDFINHFRKLQGN